MRVLALCDDYWHPASIAQQGLAGATDLGFEIDWMEDAAAWSPAVMASYPVTLFIKSDNTTAADRTPWMSDAAAQAFLSYVQAGHGLVAVHSGTVYKDQPVMRGLLGGAFLNHPPQCPVTFEPKPGHPLTAGCTPFTLKDEHYMMAFDDAEAEVFLTSTSEHSTQPAGWIRREGAGRVCVLTPGHTVEVWQHPSFRALLRNAVQACTPGEVAG